MQHAAVRGLVGIAAVTAGEVCLLDLEASLEHFAQSKALNADTMLVVVEPSFKSLATGRRMIGLARQLDPERLLLVANKVRDAGGRDAVNRLAAEQGVEVAGAVPHDGRLLEADQDGSALLDFDPKAPAVAAIDALADALLQAPSRASAPFGDRLHSSALDDPEP